MSPRTARALPLENPAAGLYPYPWTNGVGPEPVDQLILATWRADQLAALLAARLEAVGNVLDDVDAGTGLPTGTELHALSLCAVQIRQFLAEVTRLAGAYVGERPPVRKATRS